jgi:Leucine-rich repeat (LRR) protein
MENLSQNVHLEHLDLSANSIQSLSDLSPLRSLKTLMLHTNKIASLRWGAVGSIL